MQKDTPCNKLGEVYGFAPAPPPEGGAGAKRGTPRNFKTRRGKWLTPAARRGYSVGECGVPPGPESAPPGSSFPPDRLPCWSQPEVTDMLVIPGRTATTCDGLTRRELLRVGGSALLGISLANLVGLPRAGAKQATAPAEGGPGFGKAKSVILLYLQGGPSHLDLWDPKEDVPDRVRSVFKSIPTKTPGVNVTEVLPKFATVTDKVTLIRSMSYTPNGLFNHTAAIYQMLTGYTADKVSPSGQLEPPTPKDFPNFGSNIIRLKPPTEPMLPFVMMPRPLQESNVVNKSGTAGFLGR